MLYPKILKHVSPKNETIFPHNQIMEIGGLESEPLGAMQCDQP